MASSGSCKEISALGSESQGSKALPHPLSSLSSTEIAIARDMILTARDGYLIFFRGIYLEEPLKAELVPFLDLEHAGKVDQDTPRPPRLARVQYDTVDGDGQHVYCESSVDVEKRTETNCQKFDDTKFCAMSLAEITTFEELCVQSPLWQEAIAKFDLPEGFVVCLEPWPYGGLDPEEIAPRYLQGLAFAKDKSKGEYSNYYGYPLPIIPVVDVRQRKVVRIDSLATSGTKDGLQYHTHAKKVIEHCKPSDYVPELLPSPPRTDLKPLHISQPEGPSFVVSDGNLVQWQKWRFRVGFTPREGAVLHDVWYDGRSVLYRLSYSEMTVPYGDPRPPYHRKQAFDFGDGGVGRSANSLALGCDCVGTVQYLDSRVITSDGNSTVSQHVVCLHEQDAGILWKHTDFATQRATLARSREFVVQFIVTLANYDYIFSYKLDQAAGITVETRATGILSAVNIDPGKTSPWGNVVAPGILAQHHQHLFAVRVDPAIDGHNNTVMKEETVALPRDPKTNPHGNAFCLQSSPISKSSFLDASPYTNLNLKITNPSCINPVSQQPVSYKITPTPSQLLLASPGSVQSERAAFARHHAWITKYRDHELFAGGAFTFQSRKEIDGVSDAAARNEDVENADVVVWAVFGITHTPRVEDWPVMPMQKHELMIQPHDFFTANPALDAQAAPDKKSVLVNGQASKTNSYCE